MSNPDQPEIQFVPKTWGYEKIIVNREEYCGKLLFFVKGRHCSSHVHRDKVETFFLHSGRLKVYFTDDLENIERLKEEGREDKQIVESMESVVLHPGDNFHVPQGRVHRMEALLDSELYEFSSFHKDSDSYRYTSSSK